MFIAAQFFGILVIISNILAMQMKKKKQILFLFILANLFSSINFILLKSYTGAIICAFAILQNFINDAFERRGIELPGKVIFTYILISVILGALTYNSLVDVIPVICSVLYTITIIQAKESNIRKLSLINILLWVIYDLVYFAYAAAISDIITTISTFIGMYRFDYKHKKN